MGDGTEGNGASPPSEAADRRGDLAGKLSGRKVGNWLSGYLEYTSELESPDNYHVWAALSAIASVVRRNLYLDQGAYVLFPNLYIGLVGPPGRTAKSTAMWMARQLLFQVPNIKLGPDSCSREQLIRAMAEAKFNNQCAVTVHSSEFSSLIDVSGIPMIQFLTDIFDGNYSPPGGWKYETKTQGKDQLVNPVLNLFFGTTPSYLADNMPANVIGHGFTSRTIIVAEETERLVNPRPKGADPALMQALIDDLRHISMLYGQFQWTPAGMETYDAFYRGLYLPENMPTDHRLEGYHWRKKIHVLKVAMLLSLAESDSLVLDARDVTAAVQVLHNLEARMARAFSAVGKYDHAADLERIGTQIIAAGRLPISEVFARNYHSGGHDEIRKILFTLQSMRVIRCETVKGEEIAFATGNHLPWGG